MNKNTDVDAILSNISESEVSSLLSDLVQIDSTNPDVPEKEIARYVAEHLKESGCEVELQEVLPDRPNVIGRLRGAEGTPSFAFNTHIDVVPAGEGWSEKPFGGEIRDGRVYGRGSTDAKGSLACQLYAIRAVSRSGVRLKGDIVMTAVADEEFCSRGARKLVENFSADYALVGEPSSSRVVVAHRGSFRPVVVTEGVLAHSSRPDLGVNAIFAMAPVLQELEKYGESLTERKHRLCGHPTCTVTLAKGGIKDNVIPDACEVVVDRRLVPGESEEEAEREIQEVLNRVMKSNPNIKAKIDRHIPTTGGPAEIPLDHPLVNAARQAVKEVLGEDFEPTGKTGATDMNHFVRAGIPTLIIGPGDAGISHQVDEFVETQQLFFTSQVYSRLLVSLVHGECMGSEPSGPFGVIR